MPSQLTTSANSPNSTSSPNSQKLSLSLSNLQTLEISNLSNLPQKSSRFCKIPRYESREWKSCFADAFFMGIRRGKSLAENDLSWRWRGVFHLLTMLTRGFAGCRDDKKKKENRKMRILEEEPDAVISPAALSIG